MNADREILRELRLIRKLLVALLVLMACALVLFGFGIEAFFLAAGAGLAVTILWMVVKAVQDARRFDAENQR